MPSVEPALLWNFFQLQGWNWVPIGTNLRKARQGDNSIHFQVVTHTDHSHQRNGQENNYPMAEAKGRLTLPLHPATDEERPSRQRNVAATLAREQASPRVGRGDASMTQKYGEQYVLEQNKDSVRGFKWRKNKICDIFFPFFCYLSVKKLVK